MTDAKKQVAATIERAKADLDLALADLDKITDIDPKTFHIARTPSTTT